MTAAPETTRVQFGEFFEREKIDLYGAMCLVTHDRHEAEEVAQDAFVRVLERWDRISRMEDPRGYLYRTAMNVFRSRYRRAAVVARREASGRHPRCDRRGRRPRRHRACPCEPVPRGSARPWS